MYIDSDVELVGGRLVDSVRDVQEEDVPRGLLVPVVTLHVVDVAIHKVLQRERCHQSTLVLLRTLGCQEIFIFQNNYTHIRQKLKWLF